MRSWNCKKWGNKKIKTYVNLFFSPIMNEEIAYTSNCYVGMGIIFRRWGDYERALDYYQKGLEAKLTKANPYLPNLVAIYHNIGIVYTHLKNHKNASYYLEKSLAIKKEFFGDQHIYYGRTRQGIGILQGG